jgi:hypothetical protein
MQQLTFSSHLFIGHPKFLFPQTNILKARLLFAETSVVEKLQTEKLS